MLWVIMVLQEPKGFRKVLFRILFIRSAAWFAAPFSIQLLPKKEKAGFSPGFFLFYFLRISRYEGIFQIVKKDFQRKGNQNIIK